MSLVAGSALTAPLLHAIPSAPAAPASPVPLLDLHVHTTDEFPAERMLRLAEERGVRIGIVTHPGPWGVRNDAGRRRHLDALRKAQGLKFTLGSDSRNQHVGRLACCRSLIRRCALTAEDFWAPPPKA